MIVRPARNILGALQLPGDKSVSHRYAMLGAIAEGTTRLSNFSSGADCASTLGCVRQLGCAVRTKGGVVEIEGRERLQQPAESLDCGNSGSTMRMLSGILAGHEFSCELHGDESLSRRPMGRIITPLRQMGARISAAAGDRPPLRIQGGGLHAIDYKMPVASAQVKSAILFAGLFAEGETSVEEPYRTRDHSEQALRAFGVEVSRRRNRVSLSGRMQKLHAIEAAVPGDISSAAFFLCAAALFPDSNLVIESLLLNPTRASLLDVLKLLGARVSVINLEEHHGELVGTVKVEHGALQGIVIEEAMSVALIDELPVLAAIAPYTRDGIEIRDAKELRVKESDRIALVARNLRAMGAECEEREDGLRVPGGQQLHGAEIESGGDHRIAMAFAVAALRAQGESLIHGAESARVSFPEFFTMLEGVVER